MFLPHFNFEDGAKSEATAKTETAAKTRMWPFSLLHRGE
jgi:hypothetical protein